MVGRSQRTKRAATGRARVPAAPPTVAEKLKEVADKMVEIRKEEETELVSLLKKIEEITRDTMNIENEIRRQNLLKGTLDGERRTLQKEVQNLTRENRTNANTKKEAEKEREKLLEENAELKSQLSSLDEDARKFQKENSSLALEVEKLQANNERLKADVERLTALREEYMKSISEFKQLREDLLP
jgi:chromosome segregation ATPase